MTATFRFVSSDGTQFDTQGKPSLQAVTELFNLIHSEIFAFQKQCPRCGLGVDHDGDGNCGICAKFSSEVAEYFRQGGIA